MRAGMLLCFGIMGISLLAGCARKSAPAAKIDVMQNAYSSEADWNNPDRIIPLNYEQAQGKRVFYEQCVWCHADQTPAGPSNRSNVTPAPPLWNDGVTLNSLSDVFLEKFTAQGGSAMGKSAMMPPYGNTLTPVEIRALIAYARAIAVPPYGAASQAGQK
ncbi:MAG: cytochrome c [Candidatus Acidiferrales bacterium]